MHFELQMKATEVKKASSVNSEDEEGEDNKEGSVASGHTRQSIGAKGSQVVGLGDGKMRRQKAVHDVAGCGGFHSKVGRRSPPAAR